MVTLQPQEASTDTINDFLFADDCALTNQRSQYLSHHDASVMATKRAFRFYQIAPKRLETASYTALAAQCFLVKLESKERFIPFFS